MQFLFSLLSRLAAAMHSPLLQSPCFYLARLAAVTVAIDLCTVYFSFSFFHSSPLCNVGHLERQDSLLSQVHS